MTAAKVRICGYCAGAPRSARAMLSHLACQVDWCACRATGHVVTPEIAVAQRTYTHGLAETDHTDGGSR